MQIAISGSTGMVGRALATALRADGHDVVPLVRGKSEGIHWTPATGEFDQEKMADVEVLVHLAGENIAQGFSRHSLARSP